MGRRVSGAAMERAGSCYRRQLYVSKSSVTGRSPTQIAPLLRHSHRNASAIHCSCPEQRVQQVQRRTRESLFPCTDSNLSPAPDSQGRGSRQGHKNICHIAMFKQSAHLLPAAAKKFQYVSQDFIKETLLH